MNFFKSFAICSSKKSIKQRQDKSPSKQKLAISQEAKLEKKPLNLNEKNEEQSIRNERSLSTMNSGISTRISQHSQEPKKDEIREKMQKEADKYTEFIISEGRNYLIEKKIISKIMDMKNTPTHCIDMEWSFDYADYLRDGHPKPKIMDNTMLKRLVELKKASPEKHFVIVDELIWMIIMNLYGGGPEIISDTNGVIFEINDVKKEPIQIVQKAVLPSIKSIPSSNKSIEKTSPLETRKLRDFIIGISNNSYYCFINTALQCLLTFQKLNSYFQEENYNKISYKTKKSFKYTFAYQSLLKEITSNSGHNSSTYITASNFKKMFKKNFSPYEMHDSQEFLRFLLSELQDEMNPPIPAKIVKKFQLADFPTVFEAWEFYQKYHPSIIDEFFAGQMTNEIICPLCEKVSNAYDPFLDLSLTITKNTKNIYECLELFCRKEMVEQYQCEGCKKKSKAEKYMRISIEPKILVIHFKRFKIYPRKAKLNDRVVYPIDDFKLGNFSIDPRKSNYNLKAVALHSGSVDYGHYVALAKRDQNWYFFDDETVQKINWKEVQNQEAYLLFYERDD